MVKDREVWCAAVHGSQSPTRLSNRTTISSCGYTADYLTLARYLAYLNSWQLWIKPYRYLCAGSVWLWFHLIWTNNSVIVGLNIHQFSSVRSLSRVRLFATPWITARLASVHHQLPESTQTHVHGVGDDIQPSHPLLSPSRLPPILPSIGVFSNESTLHMRWPKYWSFSFNIRPSNEHPGLISFRMDWLDLLAVQGTLKHLLQHHSSKASILQHSDFLTIQLSHPHSHHTSLLLNQYKSSDNFIL